MLVMDSEQEVTLGCTIERSEAAKRRKEKKAGGAEKPDLHDAR